MTSINDAMLFDEELFIINAKWPKYSMGVKKKNIVAQMPLKKHLDDGFIQYAHGVNIIY